ncbi:PREDICTED: putative F-box protein At3g52320 [Ipomoea nil]|uniref:putative F-box protein At3g52320 n=1 Tax=Ipomoea nil TaxID=35883 RepID=UPI0009013240|nr:PREDICTED: putative F-box protein At3g52320 [Ipomoea nil]
MSASEKTAAGVSTLTLHLHLLPQDILVEILSKLPAKSLVRFRCVSKFFYALIVDHGFGVLHRTLSLTLPSKAAILIAIIPSRRPRSVPSAPAYYTINFSKENPRRPGMLQADRLGYLDGDEPFLKGCLHSSSDGLICLSRPNGDIVVVCNVSTGQRISLPRFQFDSPHGTKTCALLGFDSQSKRYKVLMIDRRSCFEYKHWVLTLGVDKSWREINYSSHPLDGVGCAGYSDTSVHIDGVIYFYNWLTRDDPPSFHIVAFEVWSESYSFIPIPAEVTSSSPHLRSIDASGETYHYTDFVLRNFALLQVDGGRLAIIYVHNIGHLFNMVVWTLEKSKGCWEKITMIIPFKFDLYRFTTNHAGEIVLLCIDSKQFFILVCNLKSEVWRKFDVGGVKEFPICFPEDVRIYKTMDHVFSIE